MRETQVGSEFDEALAQYLVHTRMALKKQIEDARDSQSMAAEHGLKLPLGEALVKLGVITAMQRETVEKLLKEEHFGEKQLGNYKLIKKIGAGTMGAVFLAEDPLAQRKVALKILSKKLAGSKDFLSRFKHEAQATGRLNHLNIVSAFDVGHAQGRYFYAMEYCEGETLEGILKREEFLLPEMALDIISQVAQGLEHAHEHGIVHRDIKPGNIILTHDGVAKILDMGLSKTMSDAEASFNTQNGLAVGTPHYMSPEQVRGDKDVDGRADIYSLGATLYQLVTGETPYKGNTPAIVMTMHINETLTNPQDIRPEIPDLVVNLIERMMAKSVKDRYQNCSELLEDVRRCVDGKPLKLPPLGSMGSSVAPRKQQNSTMKIPSLARQLSTRGASLAAFRRKQSGPRPAVVALGFIVAGLFIWVMWMLYYQEADATPLQPTHPPEQHTESPPQIPNKTPQPGKQPQPAPTPTQPPPTPPTPAPAANAGTTPSKMQLSPPSASARRIDLMPLIDVAKHTAWGNFQIKNRELISDNSSHCRLELPYTPPEEYDFQIVFTRQNGNLDVNQLLTHGGHSFMWMMSGMNTNAFGLDMVSGMRAGSNPATVKLPPLQNGRKYTSLVQVRKNYVAVFLDGKQVGVWNTNYRDLYIMPEWKLRADNLLGVGSFQSPTVFHSIEVTPVESK